MSAPSNSKNAIICQAAALLNNEMGTLSLTRRKLIWISSVNKSGTSNVTLSASDISTLFASKPSAADRKLKVVGKENAAYMFRFPKGSDADVFKENLTPVVAKNKERAAEAVKAEVAEPAASSTAGANDTAGISAEVQVDTAQKLPKSKNELKAAVLMRIPELARLHTELVRTGHLTEAEFWEGREHLVLAEAAADAQRRGKPSAIIDPRPIRDETGKAKMTLTPETVNEIFEEFPVVWRAYKENVPPLTKEKFWERYLKSKLASRNSASVRGAASEHTVQDDDVFDRYLEKEDDGFEPRNARVAEVPTTINVAASGEDHPETGNTEDITMQAGRQKQALPLIRRFNIHSERLLNSALGQQSTARRNLISANGETEYAEDIVIEDLQAIETTEGVPFDLKDQQRLFEGAPSGAAMDVDMNGAFDAESVVPILVRNLDSWASDLSQMKLEKKSTDEALGSMTQNVRSRLEGRMRKNELPDDVLHEMTSLQTATSEFLRQFWSAVHPPPPEQGVLSVATPAQLASRAEKMVNYLVKTQDKVAGIMQSARSAGVDPNKIHLAFEHTLAAVDAALKAHSARMTR